MKTYTCWLAIDTAAERIDAWLHLHCVICRLFLIGNSAPFNNNAMRIQIGQRVSFLLMNHQVVHRVRVGTSSTRSESCCSAKCRPVDWMMNYALLFKTEQLIKIKHIRQLSLLVSVRGYVVSVWTMCFGVLFMIMAYGSPFGDAPPQFAVVCAKEQCTLAVSGRNLVHF